MIDVELRRFVKFSSAQQGFINQPGCLKNIDKLSRIMKHAVELKKDVHVVLLVVKKAFNSVSHPHLKRTLLSREMPTVLRNACIAAIHDNTTSTAGCKKQKSISFLRGVAQGDPLLPVLFNLAIDDIIKELDDEEIKKAYGYDSGHEITSVAAFADDTGIAAKDRSSAQRLKDIAVAGFTRYGLTLNANKTHWLAMVKGKPYFRSDIRTLEEHVGTIITEGDDDATEDAVTITNFTRDADIEELEPLMLADEEIYPIEQHTVARYLGAHFAPMQTFERNIAITTWREQLELLIASALLRSDQKLQMFQQYLAPVLNYTFQVTPRKLIPTAWLQNLDKIVRSGIREIIGVGRDVVNNFLCSRRKDGGLAVIKYEWEAKLQRIQALSLLYQKADESAASLKAEYFREVCDCFGDLRIEFRSEPNPLEQTNLSVKLRGLLRDGAYDDWSKMPPQPGVAVYKQCPQAHRWIVKKGFISESAWKLMIPARCNAVSVRTCPRLQLPAEQQMCRHCGAKKETLGHVLGDVNCSDIHIRLINARHNNVEKVIADALRNQKFRVDTAVRCEASDGTSRRADILAIWPNDGKAIILDPTIRIEGDERYIQQALLKKREDYEPTIPWFERNYRLQHGTISVRGLWFGARGAIHTSTLETFKMLKLPTRLLEEISRLIVRHSAGIIQSHLGGNAGVASSIINNSGGISSSLDGV